MSYEYSENILVQESAGDLLQSELGWRVVFAYNQETLGESGTFGRTSYREVLLQRYFREALQKLNPWITPTQIDEAVQKFTATLSTSSLLQINEEKYGFIRDGIPVSYKKPDGTSDVKRALVIDFSNPENNDFLAVKEMKIHGEIYRRRTDIVGFVNGIPLLFVELKRNDVAVQNAYDDNYTDYLSTIPQLFYYNAFLMLSNGVEAKVGTLGSKYDFFHEWKRLKESDAGSVALQTMLRGICKKETFLDLLANFILYDHSDGNTVKILARNHQYLGVNEAFKAYEDRKLRNGKLGVFWHTQGSGKSYSMLFLSQKIRRCAKGSPTIVILTDRRSSRDRILKNNGKPDAEGNFTDARGEKAEEYAGDKHVCYDYKTVEYISWPDPGSEECVKYNGCEWAGYFAGIEGQQTEQWVSEHNIISIHEKDWDKYNGKTFRLRQNGHTIDAVVYDKCADSDCEGCCTQNAGNLGFLIDIESYSCERFSGSKEGCDGVVEWICLDCE